VDAAINLSPLDLTGKTLHAFVKLDSGSFMGGAQLHAGSGPNYTFAASTYTTFDALDVWLELTLDLTAAQSTVTGFTANDIRQIGVQFATGRSVRGRQHVPGSGGRRLPHRLDNCPVTQSLSRHLNRGMP